jgi:type IV pilus assembly protein PilX
MIRKTTNILSNENGAALVIALMMMIMLTLIGLGSIFTSTFEVKLSGNKRGSTNAFYAADSGVQVIMANIENFDLPGKYEDNQYDPFTDPANSNVTKAAVVITHIPDQHGSPRGSGFSATHFEFIYYVIDSTGQDQIEFSPVKSACTVEQKVVRLVPTLQGGY